MGDMGNGRVKSGRKSLPTAIRVTITNRQRLVPRAGVWKSSQNPIAGEFAMLNETKFYCPECDEGFHLPEMKSRRDFLKAIGATAAAATLATRTVRAAEAKPKPAE